MASSSQDEFIENLEAEFGLEGYARYWKLLEAVASQMGTNGKCSARYSWSKWQSIMKGKRSKLEKFLNYLEGESKIKMIHSGNISGSFPVHSGNVSETNRKQTGNELETNRKQTENILEIEIPNLLKFRDEYSRKSGHDQDNVAPNIRSKIQIQNTDTETDTEKNLNTYVGQASPTSISQDRDQDQNQENEPPPLELNNDEKPSKQSENKKLNSTAKELLKFLNQRAGKNFQEVEANIKPIVCRMKEGATEIQCRQIILRKVRAWATDEKMAEYLRPATLFNRTKFAQYVGELVPTPNPDESNREINHG